MLGHDVMRSGLRSYFEKHQWGHTTLPDFVACLREAYLSSPNPNDFDLEKWCDNWLRSSGVNTLAPIIEIGSDGSLHRLEIKQSCGESGLSNRLRF